MKNKVKSLGLTAMCIMSVFLVMSGCAADNKTEEKSTESIALEEGDLSKPGWQLHADDKVTLDWYVNYSWFVTRWGGNLVSDTITEETGVSVNFITPLGNEQEKLDSLIASNSLPDVITLGWWEPQVSEMISKDMVYALNELAEEYDPYFYEVSDEEIIRWYTQEDGNIYGYPNSSYTPGDLERNHNIPANQTFLVRKDIYEAIGSPDMTTQEGFYNAIVKAVELYPDIDGKPMIPIGAHVFNENGCVSFDQYLQNFLNVPHEVDGEYYDRNTDPEYLSWLKLFRRLSEEGYLAPDIFVDTRTQMSEKLAEGRYFCMLYQRTDMADQQKILYDRDPNSVYIAVDGPKNSKGDDPKLPSTGITGWTVTLISKNCKRPDRAIEFMDYLMSEHGQKLVYLGVEGVTYDVIDGQIVLKDEVKQILNTNRTEYDALYGADDAYWMLQDNVMQMQWKVGLEEPLKQPAEWTYPYTAYLGQYELQTMESYILAENKTKLDALWGATLKDLLLSESEEAFDEIVERYKSERLELNYDMMMKEYTRMMNENKQKLGME